MDETLPLLDDDPAALALHAVRPDALEALLADHPHAAFLRGQGFTAASQQLVLLPGAHDSGGGLGGAVLGLGADRSPYAFGDLPMRLPEGSVWRLAEGDFNPADAALGFCLGAYRFAAFRKPARAPARLVCADPAPARLARAVWMARDLINRPANDLGPSALADALQALAGRHGAAAFRHDGDAVEAYPAIAAVGRGSARPPVVAGFHWRGSAAGDGAPLVSLCGKGVVFDTGGYDLKPSAAMLRMKKDMGGAAVLLGVARVLMEADAPIRLAVRIGCVENSVSGTAMRPSDVITTRRGLSVEIGNTDAEGRLVLADLLDEAGAERPDLLVDCATLTGAARVALGPDLPAMFCNDDAFAVRMAERAASVHDPLWRLPLWDGYAGWLDSQVADLGNVAAKPMAGAITAALFLRRFVPDATRWVHLDLYAWNDSARPGRPEGGEASALRALTSVILNDLTVTS